MQIANGGITKSQMSLTCAPPPSLKFWSRQIELSEGEVGQRLGALRLSPVGERKADNREETLHGRRSGWNAEVLPSHASKVGAWGSPWHDLPTSSWYHPCAQIRHQTYHTRTRKTSRDLGDGSENTRIYVVGGTTTHQQWISARAHAWRRRQRPQSGSRATAILLVLKPPPPW